MKLNSCAKCPKSARSACVGCKDTPNYSDASTVNTYCWSKACQTADWNKHRIGCKDSQDCRLVHGTEQLSQAAFLAFREVLFDKKIAQVERHNSAITIQEGKYVEDELRVPLLHDLLSKTFEKHAIPTYSCFDDALAYPFDIICTTLKGM